ncbi:MAG: HD domain-containing protein [Patescibacteria group bacterium]|jgi:HD superfamily phosphodiesterase
MKQIFEKIWQLALPHQDKRNDRGHAETTLYFAHKLLETEKGDDNIIIPAIILHDIGWSKVPQEVSLTIFGYTTPQEKIAIQKRHEIEGAIMARQILTQVSYDGTLIDEIAEIISGHDTRNGFLSPNDGIVRDADKLWRYSHRGLEVDAVRSADKSVQRRINHKAENIDKDGFFYSGSARRIAREELDKRRAELL